MSIRSPNGPPNGKPPRRSSPARPEQPASETGSSLFDHRIDLAGSGSLDTRSLPAHGGVYLITNRQDQPVLLSHARNLRRVVAARLSAPTPDQKTRRVDLSHVAGRIRWRDAPSVFEALWLHRCAARQLYPRTYRKMIGFGPVWLLRVDPRERFPRFTSVKTIDHDGVRRIGPFATRKHAEQWLRMLEDAFDLCRYHAVLEQAPHGQACAYYEMGRCAAPCDGTVSMATYREAITAALDFSLGAHEPGLARLRRAMQAAAGELAFERAASLRRTIDHATELAARAEYRHLCDVRAGGWLTIQQAGPARRSERKTLVRPFAVAGGRIEALDEPVSLVDLADRVPTWLEQGRRVFAASRGASGPAVNADDAAACSELLWLVARFLFRDEPSSELFFRSDRLPCEKDLTAAIRMKWRSRTTTEDFSHRKQTESAS